MFFKAMHMRYWDWSGVNLRTGYNLKEKKIENSYILNKIGHSSRSSSIQRSKTTEEVSGNVKQF